MLHRKRLVSARLGLALLALAPAVVTTAQTAKPAHHLTAAQKKAAAKKLAAEQAAKKKAAAAAATKKKAATKAPVRAAKKPKPVTVAHPVPPTTVKPATPPTHLPMTPPVAPPPTVTAPAGPQVGQRNTPYALGGAQVTLQNAEVTDKMLPNLFGNIPPDAGTHYVLFTINVKNDGTSPLAWTFDRFNPKLETTNASDHVLRGTSLLTGSNARFETQPIQPGEDKTVRFHFQVPLGSTPKTLTLSSGNSTYVFDVSDVH